MPETTPAIKVRAVRDLGAEVVLHGDSYPDAQLHCDALAAASGRVFIHPFDDPLVIAGQGTIGLELLEDRPDLVAILVPLSGGGLAAGVALAAKAIKPTIKVIGISMDRGAAMRESIRAGRPVEVEEVASLADSLGGGIGLANRLSFALCRDLLDDCVVVTEEEIYNAMQILYFEERMVAEGASVVGIAAMKAGRLPSFGGPVATILTGRNVDMASFTDIVAGRSVRVGDMELEGRTYGA
jgi:threonine dehydratase